MLWRSRYTLHRVNVVLEGEGASSHSTYFSYIFYLFSIVDTKHDFNPYFLAERLRLSASVTLPVAFMQNVVLYVYAFHV